MFKDYQKFLRATIKVYAFVLLLIVILKIVGLDYFGIDVNNPIMLKINRLILKYNLEKVYYSLTIYFYVYMFVSISNLDNSKKAKIYSILFAFIAIFMKVLENRIANTIIIFIMDFMFLLLTCLIYNKFRNFKKILKRTVLFLIINTVIQVISLYLRSIKYFNIQLPFIFNSILDLDYVLMVLIYYSYIFYKGGAELCGMEVSLFSLKKINLKKSLKKLQKNFQSNLRKFKKKSKEEKISIIIYIILSLIWNILSVILILIVAKLNNRLIECIFILTSFWLSKGKFGKAFHFDSMTICFIVSNLTYFSLNRITTPMGISILVPVILGVGLSYVTSKFIKKTYKPLYRGMPKDLFEETISKVEEKDNIKYKICYEFYIDRTSDVSLAFKYNYSVAGIRKIKDRINKKIKELNK